MKDMIAEKVVSALSACLKKISPKEKELITRCFDYRELPLPVLFCLASSSSIAVPSILEPSKHGGAAGI